MMSNWCYSLTRNMFTARNWDRQCGEQDAHWRAMKQIASLIEAEATPDQVRAWHFYGYNDITTEPIGTTAKYWQDSRHFNFEVGDMMLADMFNKTRNKPELAAHWFPAALRQTSRICYGDEPSICNITRNFTRLCKNWSIYAQIQLVSAGAIRPSDLARK